MALNGYPPNVAFVDNFESLVAYEFGGEINAVCWIRELSGDFGEIERVLPPVEDITSIDREDLAALKLSAAGQQARAHLISDLKLLIDHGLQPSLDLVPSGPGRRNPGPVRTDVADWHADSANAPTDTYLCTYTGASSQGIAPQDAVARPDDPPSRAQLLQFYGGNDDEGFRTFLSEQFYDLHYVEKANARIFEFKQAHLWKIATKYPGCPGPPCIHRAPTTSPAAPRRLLLIS